MRYIDTTDLPSDPHGSFGDMRRVLRMAFNGNRSYPHKLELLKKTLQFVIDRIEDNDLEKALSNDPTDVLDDLDAVILKRGVNK